MDIIDPCGRIGGIASASGGRSAAWPPDLRQVRTGVLGNGKPNVGAFLDLLSQGLEARGAATACTLVKPGPTTPAGAERISQLVSSANVVVTGVCDGGTATSWGVHDALTLVAQGVPVVLVCTDAFIQLARSLLPPQLQGLRVLTIPHPFSSLTDREVGNLADATLPRLLSLVQPGGPATGFDGGGEDLAPSFNVDDDACLLSDQLYAAGWSDGLPAFLPTRDRVERMLREWHGSPKDAGFAVPPRNGLATAETIAANAVLSGLPARLLPYLAAALEATCKPDFNLFGIQTTTNPAAPVLVVGGPQRRAYGFNDGLGALGPGSQSNATLGHALRLCHQNLGGVSARNGTDPATLGQPGKYLFCFAENEDASPWPPLRMQVDPQSMSVADDAITVMAATGTTNLIIKSRDGEELLDMLASSLRCTGSNDYMFGGHPLLILCPEHAQILARDGWTLDVFRQRLFDATKIPFSAFLPKNREMTIAPRRHEFERLELDTLIPMTEKPSDLLVCVAGGPSMHSTFVPSFGGFRPATAKVRFG